MVNSRLLVALGFFLTTSLSFAQTVGIAAPAADSAPALVAPAASGARGLAAPSPISGQTTTLTQTCTTAETDGAPLPQPEVASLIPNSFAAFISESLGRSLPIFGHALFQRAPTTFSPVETAAVTPDYVIGVGDQLIVRVWGQAEFELPITVERDGTIALPKAGEVRVAGVQYRDINAHLRSALSRVFRNFELTVSMGRLVPITVFVVGEAKRPGHFLLSPQSTLFNAIFAVGGPSEQGSLRSVKLKRNEKIVADIDVYTFIKNGDRSGDVRLLADDMIVFEKAGPLVAIAGSINRPGIYELKSPTIGVADALEMAGGFTNTATDTFATLERLEERKSRSVTQLSLTGDKLKLSLRDGDLLQIFPIGPRFDNAITVRGNVAMPLRHPWRQGVRVSDLIPNKEALLSATYWQAQNRLVFTDPKGGDAIKNEIKRILPEINWSYALVERIGDNLRPNLIPFNLEKAILQKDPANDLELAPGDLITIFSKDDIAVPMEERTVYVTLSGEVRVPGVYQLKPGESLKEAIERAGGVTDRAFLLGTALQREAIRREQQHRIDEIVAKIEQDLRASTAEMASTVIGAESRTFFENQMAFQQRALRAFRGAAVNGRLYLGLPRRTDLKVSELPNIALEDGDLVYLPPRLDTVNVFGAVGFQNSQIFGDHRSVDEYIEMAGGMSRRAEPEDLLVLSIDGAAHKRDRSWYAPWTWGRDIALMPGDSIFVPEKIDSVPFVAQLKDWTQVLYQLGLGAAALKTLRN